MNSTPSDRTAEVPPANRRAARAAADTGRRTGPPSPAPLPRSAGEGSTSSLSPSLSAPRRAATGIAGPVTGSGAARGASEPGRVPPLAPAGSAHASPAADSVLPAGQIAIAAAMAEDRGRDSLDAHVRRLMKDLGLLAYHTKTAIGSERGFPDWTIAGSRTLFRELKRQGKDPTAAQQKWLDALAAAGNDVGVWRPEDLLSGRIARELTAISWLSGGAP
jgi:hypothetical protein